MSLKWKENVAFVQQLIQKDRIVPSRVTNTIVENLQKHSDNVLQRLQLRLLRFYSVIGIEVVHIRRYLLGEEILQR